MQQVYTPRFDRKYDHNNPVRADLEDGKKYKFYFAIERGLLYLLCGAAGRYVLRAVGNFARHELACDIRHHAGGNIEV